VHNFAISIDGYGAAPNQDAQNPLGLGGLALHAWIFGTQTFKKLLRVESGTTGLDDVRVGGGVSTIQQFLRARLIDEAHIAIVPILLGSGEHLTGGVDLPSLGYRITEHAATQAATHVVLTKT